MKHRHGQQEEADKDPPWTVQPKICEEYSVDAMSAEHERRLVRAESSKRVGKIPEDEGRAA